MPGGLNWPGHRVGVVDEHLTFEAVGIAEEQREVRAEVGDEVVGRASCHQPAPDLLEGLEVLRPQADVVDAPPTEHRHLTLGLGVALDLEHVEHGAVADVDEGEAEPLLAAGRVGLADHARLEDLPVERVEPRRCRR